jgi:hypothetical protein
MTQGIPFTGKIAAQAEIPWGSRIRTAMLDDMEG